MVRSLVGSIGKYDQIINYCIGRAKETDNTEEIRVFKYDLNVL